jgi:colanic acid biosynthesis glycosyl transferase WcaI
MRVTFLTQWFEPEPGAIRGLPLARELVRRGIAVDVVTGFPNYPGGRVYPGYRVRPWCRESIDGVSVLRVALFPSHSRNPFGRVANYGSFALSAGVLGPRLTPPSDILYVYHPPPTVGLAAAAFQRRRNIPIVYHIADMWPDSVVESGMLGNHTTKRVVGDALGAYCKWVYRQASAITVLSPGFKQLLVERGVPADRVHVVYNWADDELFHPMPRDEMLAQELGMAGKFNVVYAGNFGAFQGLETVIQAAERLRHVDALQVVLVGTGVEEERLRALTTRLKLTNVRFVSRRPMSDMPRINALSDVLLTHLRDLPFFASTIPSKTQVSLASGRPVIMAVRGDAASLISEAGAGSVVPPESVDDLARAMFDLYSMPAEQRERLGALGHQYYMREMSLGVGTSKMIDIFQRLASHDSRPLPARMPLATA